MMFWGLHNTTVSENGVLSVKIKTTGFFGLRSSSGTQKKRGCLVWFEIIE